MKTILTLSLLFLSLLLHSQEIQNFYEDGMKNFEEADFVSAIENFDKELEIDETAFQAWYFKGLAKFYLGYTNQSIADVENAISFNDEFAELFFELGRMYIEINDLDAAKSMFDKGIAIDSTISVLYYFRGFVNEVLGRQEDACADITRYNKLSENPNESLEELACTKKRDANYFNVLEVSKKARRKSYGFSNKNPIKVGTGFRGGPSNQRDYLDLLRDAMGNRIQYERAGSSGSYKSENGMFGNAVIDVYEITYFNKKGQQITDELYISFYDHEELMIPKGLFSISQK